MRSRGRWRCCKSGRGESLTSGFFAPITAASCDRGSGCWVGVSGWIYVVRRWRKVWQRWFVDAHNPKLGSLSGSHRTPFPANGFLRKEHTFTWGSDVLDYRYE
jgi:hypothetical protein